MDVILAVLRHNGGSMAALDVARQAKCTYPQAYQALGYLVKDGLAEKVRSDEMQRLHHLHDGRVVALGPPAGAVGWRAKVTPGEVDELEALWDAPAVDER